MLWFEWNRALRGRPEPVWPLDVNPGVQGRFRLGNEQSLDCQIRQYKFATKASAERNVPPRFPAYRQAGAAI